MLRKSFLVLGIIPLTCAFAEESQNIISIEQELTLSAEPLAAPAAEEISKALEIPFNAFTGKIKGKKVRLRLRPDLESQIVKELNRNDYITVIGEKGDFWAVEAPSNTKAYVFRRFVIDNEVEGNKVNVRLEPSLESPVIGHLNAGDKIHGVICALNNKWMEIAPPTNTQFYIAKEYVSNAGGPEFKEKFEMKKKSGDELFEKATLVSKNELEKSYEEIDIDEINLSFTSLIDKYSDFPEMVEKSKEALTLAQEAYLQKKLAYLEMQKEEAVAEREDAVAAQKERTIMQQITDKMKLWEPIEEALYLSWAQINDDKSQQDFYEQQKVNPVVITGIIEAYSSPVKNKPGDFVVKDKEIPVGYLYSTKINLNDFVGKKVTAIVSQRPNNNFAFPAYYVLNIE